MAGLKLEYLAELPPDRRRAILRRSQEDVSAVLDEVRPILAALRLQGDQETLRQHRQFKEDLSALDLEAAHREIEAAYEALDPKVLGALKAAAANIEKFHRAQVGREMWALEVQPGLLAGRLTRPLERVGCTSPAGWRLTPPAP